jgi:hypothetical protein
VKKARDFRGLFFFLVGEGWPTGWRCRFCQQPTNWLHIRPKISPDLVFLSVGDGLYGFCAEKRDESR